MCSKVFGGDGRWQIGVIWGRFPFNVTYPDMNGTTTTTTKYSPEQTLGWFFSQKTLQKCWKMKPQWIWCRVKFQMNGLRCLQINQWFFCSTCLRCPFLPQFVGPGFPGSPGPGLPRLALWEFAPWLRPVDFEWPSEVVEVVGITWPTVGRCWELWRCSNWEIPQPQSSPTCGLCSQENADILWDEIRLQNLRQSQILQKLIVWLYYALLVEVLSWIEGTGKMQCSTHRQEILPLGPPVPEPLLPASAPMPAPFAGGRGYGPQRNHPWMARHGNFVDGRWLIIMMNAHCHDGCDVVRCPEGFMYDNLRLVNILSSVRLIWFSQSLCDFDMQHVLSDSWFGRSCLPHLLQSKQSATASCSRQGVLRFKQSCLLDHPLHSWDSWFQWKHIFWLKGVEATNQES